jgi:hypothetical protein
MFGDEEEAAFYHTRLAVSETRAKEAMLRPIEFPCLQRNFFAFRLRRPPRNQRKSTQYQALNLLSQVTDAANLQGKSQRKRSGSAGELQGNLQRKFRAFAAAPAGVIKQPPILRRRAPGPAAIQEQIDAIIRPCIELGLGHRCVPRPSARRCGELGKALRLGYHQPIERQRCRRQRGISASPNVANLLQAADIKRRALGRSQRLDDVVHDGAEECRPVGEPVSQSSGGLSRGLAAPRDGDVDKDGSGCEQDRRRHFLAEQKSGQNERDGRLKELKDSNARDTAAGERPEP